MPDRIEATLRLSLDALHRPQGIAAEAFVNVLCNVVINGSRIETRPELSNCITQAGFMVLPRADLAAPRLGRGWNRHRQSAGILGSERCAIDRSETRPSSRVCERVVRTA